MAVVPDSRRVAGVVRLHDAFRTFPAGLSFRIRRGSPRARCGRRPRACAGRALLIVGASRGAADDLARRLAAERCDVRVHTSQPHAAGGAHGDGGAGAGRADAEHAAGRRGGRRPGRVRRDEDAALRYFAPVAETPGFPRAVARRCRTSGCAWGAPRSPACRRPGRTLRTCWTASSGRSTPAATVDRAAAVSHGRASCSCHAPDLRGAASILLLDVPLDHPAERELVGALIDCRRHRQRDGAHGGRHRADGDRLTRDYFAARGAPSTSTASARRRSRLPAPVSVHRRRAADRATLDGSLEFFSAPGEGRECVEIARRMLDEAPARRAGSTRWRSSSARRTATSACSSTRCGRAGVPAWFDRGTRRPHPAGRAFLALLACAAEQLSAAAVRRIPVARTGAATLTPSGRRRGRRRGRRGVRRRRRDRRGRRAARRKARDGGARRRRTADAPVVAGTLRAPWRWEQLLVEAAVIGQDAARWRRRLDGQAARAGSADRRGAARRTGDDERGASAASSTAREQLEHLRAFALPIVEELAAWPAQATWGEWLDAFEALAPRVLRTPAHVLRVLADLRPMADVGPIDLDEARRVLADRLLTLESEPPARRFGRVFVGTPQQARGRSVPRGVRARAGRADVSAEAARGSAAARRRCARGSTPALPTQRDRLAAERLLLQLAAGAASERLYVSYPRIELSESRARVPSFYALDVMRAATGRVPDHEWLEERARAAGNATLAWPAPPTPRGRDRRPGARPRRAAPAARRAAIATRSRATRTTC